jgi:hypothetical protein
MIMNNKFKQLREITEKRIRSVVHSRMIASLNICSRATSFHAAGKYWSVRLKLNTSPRLGREVPE